MALSETLRSELTKLVSTHPVVLFMKGSRRAPQCGFSAQVVQILDELLPNYQTVNVLESPELRDGIKEYSSWPTIPQLFIGGQFVGGCDIVRELHASNELAKLLGRDVAAPTLKLPSISVSEQAAKAFAAALLECPGDSLHLKIDDSFQYDLFFGPREAGEIELSVAGLTLLIDPPSARRADGLSIDFVDGAQGGFKIDNPNEPPSVKQLSAPELKAKLERGEVLLFDVRPDAERALASIQEARALDEAGQAYLRGLPRDTAIALHCHHGVRSDNAGRELLREGFRRVYNLAGGIDAWSQTVDPSVPRY
ncbi:MAG TPA: Grx4 family monothiol glutaredoxin [Polyangiaceae bacterium]|jgi:monothiol glutaredoxin